MTESSLAAIVLDQVTERLSGFGSTLAGESRMAIQGLLEALEAGLRGELDKVYHLSSIDPGIGKSLSVATFLRAWKENGFLPRSSVLIGLSRLEEIETYLRTSGLCWDEIAVLTSDKDKNDLGLHPAQHGTAPVMFTTQQMIQSRTKYRRMEKVKEFHFQGEPRVLRIWDESLIPADALSLRLDDLGLLASPFRREFPEYVGHVKDFTSDLEKRKPGDIIRIPANLSFKTPNRSKRSSGDAKVVVETLERMAGQDMVLVDGGPTAGLSLTGSAPSLPDDFAPAIILDASGRVRSTYRHWEERLRTLHRLPAAANDYGALRVYLWERPVGQQAFSGPATMYDVCDAIAEAIAADASKDTWLIIHYLNHDITKPLRERLGKDHHDRLQFLTWGKHWGTNAHADCRKVVLVGQMTYNDGSYLAYAAAVGGKPDECRGMVPDIKAGEYRHHMLQALTRASVRRSANGRSGACIAYVIASPNQTARDLIAETFPGCTIEDWQPSPPKTSGQPAQLIALLEQCRRDGRQQVPKKELSATMGLPASNFSRLLSRKEVVSYMERNHFWTDHYSIIHGGHFDPWPTDDGFVLAD